MFYVQRPHRAAISPLFVMETDAGLTVISFLRQISSDTLYYLYNKNALIASMRHAK